MKGELYLHPINKLKIYESKFIEKFINVKKSIVYNINYRPKINLNKEIIKGFAKQPDIIIINFNEKINNNIHNIINIPRIPIYIDDVFYISPISLKNINGFSNEYQDKEYLKNDFIYRIIKIYGGIISYKDYNVPIINYVDFTPLHI